MPGGGRSKPEPRRLRQGAHRVPGGQHDRLGVESLAQFGGGRPAPPPGLGKLPLQTTLRPSGKTLPSPVPAPPLPPPPPSGGGPVGRPPPRTEGPGPPA